MSRQTAEKIKKKREPKIIVQYEPNSNFDEEFAEFASEVLDWKEIKKYERKNNDSGNN